MRERRAISRFPRIEVLGRSGRRYLVFRGPLTALPGAVEAMFSSPVLWWPDDRAWFVHTELDAVSTYIGGSRGLVDRLVGEQVLESFEVELDTLAAVAS